MVEASYCPTKYRQHTHSSKTLGFGDMFLLLKGYTTRIVTFILLQVFPACLVASYLHAFPERRRWHLNMVGKTLYLK